jgi:hypothetical protein
VDEDPNINEDYEHAEIRRTNLVDIHTRKEPKTYIFYSTEDGAHITSTIITETI